VHIDRLQSIYFRRRQVESKHSGAILYQMIQEKYKKHYPTFPVLELASTFSRISF